jgi:oligoribonuclease NrnB/cAMP/cGMP phosphodiesterase (DHH superfamily)
MYKRIITHNDFDGVVSAAVCSQALGIDYIVFTGPRAVSEARISITVEDVVCDLPYPLECGLWFDHHEGNLEELQYRKIDPATVAGRFEIKESCSRVVFDYFQNQGLPDHFIDMVQEADIIDSFGYASIEEWRTATPGKIIDSAIRLRNEQAEAQRQFLRSLIGLLKERPIADVAKTPSVQKRYKIFQQEEEQMLEQMRSDLSFLPQDEHQQLILLDMTRHNKRPNVFKSLAYLLFPESLAVLEIKNVFRNDVKTNDLSVSMSLSLNLNSRPHQKDVGDIMRRLNIGSGHPGAGAGILPCSSKEEMLRNKKKVLDQIYAMFVAQ